MLHILEHSLHDLIPMIPFLFLTYLLMEYIEHKNNQRFETFLIRAQKLGPLIGSFLGIISLMWIFSYCQWIIYEPKHQLRDIISCFYCDKR